MDVYTRNAAVIDVPHVDSVIDFNAVSMLVTRESIAFSWACHFRVEFIRTSRIQFERIKTRKERNRSYIKSIYTSNTLIANK
jgi:hypothetical protein